MRGIHLLHIILIISICYALIPFSGAYYNRFKWRQFRKRFNKLRQSTLLDYSSYRQLKDTNNMFHFTGGIESITDGRTLWIRGLDMTIPISLEKTKCYLFPIQ